MSGLAKTAESEKPIEKIVHPEAPLSTSSSGEMQYLGIPVDMYAFFDLDLAKASEKQRDKMNFINQTLSKKHESQGERLMALKDMTRKFGMSGFDTNLEKVYRYLRLSSDIEDLENRRRALER